jgi:hypothetical protein
MVGGDKFGFISINRSTSRINVERIQDVSVRFRCDAGNNCDLGLNIKLLRLYYPAKKHKTR